MSLKNAFIIEFLKNFDENPFLVKMKDEEYLIGTGEPKFTVILNKDIEMKELLRSTSLALGEGYMRGDLDIEGDLYQALDLFIGQLPKFSTDYKALKSLIFSSNSKKNQKKEVSSHYDIGNEFYELWLDKTLSYSCGYFKNDSDTLYDAQINKVDRILEKLYIKEGMTMLDVGCGWGFLLIQAAKKYKVKGLGITLSSEQHGKFQKLIAQEGLEEYLSVELMDYRDLPKKDYRFDRVVSVGMIEHVGRDNYDRFLSAVNHVLQPQGLFLLHFISGMKESPGDPWIKKYIFPGGIIPTLREILNLCGDYNLRTLDVESLRRHYNKTLLCWSRNFNEHRDEIEKKMGTEFTRMWDLYLCVCAAAFHNGIIDLHQVLLSKDVNNELPMTRWY